MQCATRVTQLGGPVFGVNPGVLIQTPAHGMISLGGNYALAPKTGGPDAHNPVAEPSCVARKQQGNQGPPAPGPPAAGDGSMLWAGWPGGRGSQEGVSGGF